MALQKMKVMKNGESGEYWKITSCVPNYQTMMTVYIIELFKDNTFSKIDSIQGNKKIFNFSTTKEEFAGDLRAVGYTKILAKANSITKPATPGKPAIHGDEDLKDAINA